MKSVQLDSVHTRQFLIKCNSFSQLNDMTNCPHPFATLGDCEQVLPPSVVAAHPTRCVYLWPCQSILVPRRVCLEGNVKVGTDGRSVCWSVNCIRPSEIGARGGAIALSFRLEIPHLERHDMRCHFKILWHVTFSAATTLDYFAWDHFIVGSPVWWAASVVPHPVFFGLHLFSNGVYLKVLFWASSHTQFLVNKPTECGVREGHSTDNFVAAFFLVKQINFC